MILTKSGRGRDWHAECAEETIDERDDIPDDVGNEREQQNVENGRADDRRDGRERPFD
jgi:hypothetical protein